MRLRGAFRSVEPPNVYSTEDLPPFRAGLLFLLRRAKKISNGKLTGCGSLNANVFAYIVTPDPTAKSQKVHVRTMEKLEFLCDAIGIIFSALTDGISDLWRLTLLTIYYLVAGCCQETGYTHQLSAVLIHVFDFST